MKLTYRKIISLLKEMRSLRAFILKECDLKKKEMYHKMRTVNQGYKKYFKMHVF